MGKLAAPKLDDDRGKDTLRQKFQVRISEAGNLGQPGIDVIRGMKVDLDQAHALERARLHMVNARWQA